VWGITPLPFHNGGRRCLFVKVSKLISTSDWKKFIAPVRGPETSEWFSMICYYFWGQHCCWTETGIIGDVFYKFPLPSTPSFPLFFRCSGSLGRIWIVSVETMQIKLFWIRNCCYTIRASEKVCKGCKGRHRARVFRRKLTRLYGTPFLKILYLTDLAQKLLSLRRDSSFCAKSVRYNIFTNGAPYVCWSRSTDLFLGRCGCSGSNMLLRFCKHMKWDVALLLANKNSI